MFSNFCAFQCLPGSQLTIDRTFIYPGFTKFTSLFQLKNLFPLHFQEPGKHPPFMRFWQSKEHECFLHNVAGFQLWNDSLYQLLYKVIFANVLEMVPVCSGTVLCVLLIRALVGRCFFFNFIYFCCCLFKGKTFKKGCACDGISASDCMEYYYVLHLQQAKTLVSRSIWNGVCTTRQL